MVQAIQQFLFWRKFRSLNKQYNTLIAQAQREGDATSKQQVEERFWYETAILLEERRRYQSRKTSLNSHSTHLPSAPMLSRPRMNSPLPTSLSSDCSPTPPSGLFILAFSVLSGIALGTGIIWLVAPYLLYQ